VRTFDIKDWPIEVWGRKFRLDSTRQSQRERRLAESDPDVRHWQVEISGQRYWTHDAANVLVKRQAALMFRWLVRTARRAGHHPLNGEPRIHYDPGSFKPLGPSFLPEQTGPYGHWWVSATIRAIRDGAGKGLPLNLPDGMSVFRQAVVDESPTAVWSV
jgi:hypothetical protein